MQFSVKPYRNQNVLPEQNLRISVLIGEEGPELSENHYFRLNTCKENQILLQRLADREEILVP
jgi:hypothetical protein